MQLLKASETFGEQRSGVGSTQLMLRERIHQLGFGDGENVGSHDGVQFVRTVQPRPISALRAVMPAPVGAALVPPFISRMPPLVPLDSMLTRMLLTDSAVKPQFVKAFSKFVQGQLLNTPGGNVVRFPQPNQADTARSRFGKDACGKLTSPERAHAPDWLTGEA